MTLTAADAAKDLVIDGNDDFIKEFLQLTLKEIFKQKKERITNFFNDYKSDLSEVNFSENKKIIKTIHIPIFLDIQELEKELKIQVYCSNPIDALLLDMSNVGVVNIRKEHRAIINKFYKTNFDPKQELYIEPTSRLDIFYKKALEISTNG